MRAFAQKHVSTLCDVMHDAVAGEGSDHVAYFCKCLYGMCRGTLLREVLVRAGTFDNRC